MFVSTIVCVPEINGLAGVLTRVERTMLDLTIESLSRPAGNRLLDLLVSEVVPAGPRQHAEAFRRGAYRGRKKRQKASRRLVRHFFREALFPYMAASQIVFEVQPDKLRKARERRMALDDREAA